MDTARRPGRQNDYRSGGGEVADLDVLSGVAVALDVGLGLEEGVEAGNVGERHGVGGDEPEPEKSPS